MKQKAKHKLRSRPQKPEPSPGELLVEMNRKRLQRSRLYTIAFVFIGLFIFAERFLVVRSHRDLPSVVGSGRACESFLARMPTIFPDRVHRETECYLKFARERYVNHPKALDEGAMIRLASLFRAEKRMNSDVLFQLMELWIVTHPSRAGSELDRIKGDFDIAEALIGIMEFFEVQPVDLAGRVDAVESRRKQKLFELLKCSEWFRSMRERMSKLEQEARRVKSSAELSLLELRIKKMNQRMRSIPERWKMGEVLDSLRVDDTYPEQVRKIRSIIPWGG